MNKFIMLVGLPGAGKTSIAKILAEEHNMIVYSSDALREELFGDENNNKDNKAVFRELHKRIKEDLAAGKNVIYDATNISYKRRKAFLHEVKKYNCKKVCYLIATPYKDCLVNNKNRERYVPHEVIKRMYTSFYIPQKYEGWDEIIIHWSKTTYCLSYHTLIKELDAFSQENPHHSLTLGQHLRKCANHIQVDRKDKHLMMAGLLHDIGKPFTKTFIDKKGRMSSTAHYYNHHHVGAYDALFYLKSSGFDDESILLICGYIQWHMQPYFIKTEKAKDRFIKLVGNEFYTNLMALHEADKAAH